MVTNCPPFGCVYYSTLFGKMQVYVETFLKKGSHTFQKLLLGRAILPDRRGHKHPKSADSIVGALQKFLEFQEPFFKKGLGEREAESLLSPAILHDRGMCDWETAKYSQRAPTVLSAPCKSFWSSKNLFSKRFLAEREAEPRKTDRVSLSVQHVDKIGVGASMFAGAVNDGNAEVAVLRTNAEGRFTNRNAVFGQHSLRASSAGGIVDTICR